MNFDNSKLVFCWSDPNCLEMLQIVSKGLCNNYQEGGAEKLELSSKKLDSTPLQNKNN